MTKLITIALLLFMWGGLVLWDIFVAIEPTPGDTVSRVSLEAFTRHPALAICLGIVIAHLFWPMYFIEGARLWFTIALVIVVIAAIVLDVKKVLPIIDFPIIYILIGIPLGRLWPQWIHA